MKRRILKEFVHTNEQIDYETGEIIKEVTTKKVVSIVKSSDDFIKLYANNVVSNLAKLDDEKDSNDYLPAIVKVLFYAMKEAQYNTNKVYMVKHEKEKMSKELGISIKMIERSLRELVKFNILIHYGGKRSATYILNPAYAFKGDEIERTKVFNIIYQYRIENDSNVIEMFPAELESDTGTDQIKE